MAGATDRAAKCAAERVARHRKRRAEGLVRLEIWLDEFKLLEALEEVGRLIEPRADATARLVKDWIAFVTRNGRDPVPHATVDVESEGPE